MVSSCKDVIHFGTTMPWYLGVVESWSKYHTGVWHILRKPHTVDMTHLICIPVQQTNQNMILHGKSRTWNITKTLYKDSVSAVMETNLKDVFLEWLYIPL